MEGEPEKRGMPQGERGGDGEREKHREGDGGKRETSNYADYQTETDSPSKHTYTPAKGQRKTGMNTHTTH